MSEFVGTVSEIKDRDWRNGIILWQMRLEGSPIVHNCGTHKPPVEVGQMIKFREANRQVVMDSIQPADPSDVPSAEPNTAPARESSENAPNAPGGVGERIRKQAARHDAVMLVTTAMETNLLPFPKSGKAEDKWGRLLDLINETTKDLLEQEDEEWTKRSE